MQVRVTMATMGTMMLHEAPQLLVARHGLATCSGLNTPTRAQIVPRDLKERSCGQ
jgi:hypothetical protein